MEVRKRSQGGGPAAGSAITGSGSQRPRTWVAVALIVVALLLVATFVYAVPALPGVVSKAASSFFSQLGGPQTNSSQESSTSQSFTVYSPLILNGSANVSYPTNYDTLAAYAVTLINHDRSNYSLGAVTLSPNRAGQQHAESMLTYDYFSHEDTQGYKPYMRYTLLGGTGGVFENVAFVSYSNIHYTTVSALDDSLKVLEYQMMYNDSVCCQNGHRINILNPLHNRVSIGIAYNSTSLFFDEDFENYYVNMNVTVSKTYTVTMEGTPLSSSVSSSEAFLGFDGLPTAETAFQLNTGPREYTPGTIAGGVLPPCSRSCSVFAQGITVYAQTWEFTSSKVLVSFSISDFINRYGPGVYTIYLVTGQDTNSAITSFSVFVGQTA